MNRADPAGPVKLPRGRHGLERAFVIQNQRDRILDAIAQEVADKGYTQVTVAGVIARARVSSKTFYEFFSDKAACFLAAYDAAIELLMGHIAAVYEQMPDPSPERARAVLAAVLEVFAAEPAFARMCMVEVAAAGPDAVRRYVSVVDGFLPLVEQIEHYEATIRHRGGERHDPVLNQALIGGIAWVIYKHIASDQTELLPDLLPDLTHYLLAPFLDERQAAAIAYGSDKPEQPVAAAHPPATPPPARTRGSR